MAAAFTVMEKTQRFLLETVEGEVKDFWPGERAEHIRVVLEVGVVLVLKVSYLEAVEVGSGGANKDISCGGGGGSFNNGTNQQNECCYNTAGHGKVIITFLH